MADVSIRDLRNHGGDVVDRATGGERITVTRDGKPVARLTPVGMTPLSAETLLERWRTVPAGNLDRLHADTDAVIDPGL